MIAVDAGAHLASMIRILQRDMPLRSEKLPPQGYSRILDNGPFAGLRFPHLSAKANGLHIFREILHGFLITHPHLDHLSGMAINTPALEYGREAKAIVALPSTIEAIKSHIFNDWLWPNLSDEGHGVGFVTYRRLIEGGNPRLGLGASRGYVNVCDGLATKCWGVSHGRCHRRAHSISHQHGDSFGYMADYNFPSRRMSRISDHEHGYFAAVQQQQHSQNASAYVPPQAIPMSAIPATPGVPGGQMASSHLDSAHMFEPVASSAFFIRNDLTGNELLIWGDVEPDSVSLSPRNHVVWDDAAGKVADDRLKAIFIECSYDDSTRDMDLYGHLCPRHLVAELTFLAHCVINRRKHKTSNGVTATEGPVLAKVVEEPSKVLDMSMRQPPTPSEMKRKRKRALNGDLAITPELGPTHFDAPVSPIASGYVGTRSVSSTRRKQSHEPRESNVGLPPPATPGRGRNVSFQTGPVAPHIGNPTTTHQRSASLAGAVTHPVEKLPEPLKGVTIHIIHVKDTLMDGPPQGDIIVGQLRTLGHEAGLGCEFNVTNCGDSIWV